MKWRLVVLVILIGLITSIRPVSAQDPTPTTAPTPAYISEIEIEPGVSFIVERNFSYGDIAVVAAVILLVIVKLVSSVTSLVSQTIRN